MAKGSPIPYSDYLAFIRARDEGQTRARAAAQVRISYESAKRFEAQGRDTKLFDARKAWALWDAEQEAFALKVRDGFR